MLIKNITQEYGPSPGSGPKRTSVNSQNKNRLVQSFQLFGLEAGNKKPTTNNLQNV